MTYEKNNSRKFTFSEKLYLLAASIGIAVSIFIYYRFTSGIALAISGILISLSVILGVIYPFWLHRKPSTSVDMDLTFLLQHMYSISTGSPPREAIFDCVGRENIYPKYSPIFLKIFKLGKEWGYSFPQACALVANEVKSKVLKEILSRLSTVLAIGENVELFLKTELSTIISEFETQYMRTVEAARVFLGIYTSLLASSVFMLANFLLLAFFFGGDVKMVVTSYFFVLATVVSVAVLLYLTMPSEVYETKVKPRPKTYRMIDLSSAVISTAAIASSVYLALIGRMSFNVLGALSIIYGAAFLVPGWMAKGIEGLIREIDDFFPVFIRSYALNYETIPNMAKALKPMLIVELGKLTRILENLYARLLNSIDPTIAWGMVASESRSELVRRFLRIFIDTIERGGRVSEVGASLSDHHNLIVRLRRNRLQIAKTFETTTYVMQGAIVVINVFVVNLLYGFSSLLSSMQAQIPTSIVGPLFGSQIPLEPVMYMTAIFSVATAALNAFSIARVTPGVSRAFWYYLGILMMISGAGIILGSMMMNYILGSTLHALSNLTLTSF
ncbi:MAG TPA: hypothetical protein ENO36_02725 [Fervidicoccus fontis]|uniref:Uncharacterized protein n=1 Tax=Fervidicoccus fontis TaxID=683846 RepID=A0A7C2YSC4_9CREN|nr:hypothetical protein [Fervidicoccus fontis]